MKDNFGTLGNLEWASKINYLNLCCLKPLLAHLTFDGVQHDYMGEWARELTFCIHIYSVLESLCIVIYLSNKFSPRNGWKRDAKTAKRFNEQTLLSHIPGEHHFHVILCDSWHNSQHQWLIPSEGYDVIEKRQQNLICFSYECHTDWKYFKYWHTIDLVAFFLLLN